MKCIISLKEQYGKEVATYKAEGKHTGDVLQNMEDQLCNEIKPYSNYSLQNRRNIEKKASKKTLHFEDQEGNAFSYVIEIKDSDF